MRQGPVSTDGRSTSLVVSLGDLDASARQDAVERIETGVDPGPLDVSYGGEVATLLDARHDFATDFWKLELAPLLAPGAILASLIGAAATGVLTGASLYPAREFGLAVGVGLLLDLVLLRIPLIAVLARRAPS